MDTVVCFNRVGFESPKELQQHCQTSGELGDAAGMRAFRLLRVMRVVRLVKRFQSIQRQVKVITSTVSAVSSLMLLLAVFLLIFSIVGMRIFGSKSIDSLGDPPSLSLASSCVDAAPAHGLPAFAVALVPGPHSPQQSLLLRTLPTQILPMRIGSPSFAPASTPASFFLSSLYLALPASCAMLPTTRTRKATSSPTRCGFGGKRCETPIQTRIAAHPLR